MTLRSRLAILASIAVMVAVLAASVSAWLLIRSTLLSDVDDQLLDQAPQLARVALRLDELPPATEMMVRLQGEPVGIQQLDPDGEVIGVFPPGDVALALDPAEQRLLDGESAGPLLRTVTHDGTPYRAMTVVLEDGRMIRLMQSLERVERTMTRMAWLLAGVAALGVALAGGFGWLVARAGLRPVNQLAAAAEQVATTKDLAHRVDAAGTRRDEVARLAASLNTMLAALESARTQQRHLVEDAGHELRTPLATLRNDIGLLVRSEHHPQRTLTADDRAALLWDLEAQIAGLSDLVNELVDLARGGVEPEPLLETDLRSLVDRAVARTRRVNPAVRVVVTGDSFEACVRPTMLERAVANLVRNAVQVSPDGWTVEVELTTAGVGAGPSNAAGVGAGPSNAAGSQAVVSVRDRGPGITPTDLPRLFDRFYRGAGARQRPGSGLGLAIAQQAAERHGGLLTAGNRPGGGAVFTLQIPTHPPAS